MTFEEYNKWHIYCKDKYNKKTFQHALRLIDYLAYDLRVLLMNPEQKYNCLAIAIGHDIIEDTDATIEDIKQYIPEEVVNAIMLLSKDDNMTYPEYIKDIIDSDNIYAIIVKQADIYDHMSQTKTLTPRLRAKYKPIIPKLIGLEDS